jgi:serine/threonine-protein kinase
VAEALLQRDSVRETLGHYDLGERIGAGGMGEVFRARDEHLDREVAIKVLPPGMLADPIARRHFHQEALALSKLNHPNIATVYDFDTQRGKDFLVMEYIPGLTLSEMLSHGPLPAKEVAELGMQMAAGLAAAHQEGVIHRDLKPRNIRITPNGRLKILDFGLARLMTGLDPSEELTASQSQSWVLAGTLPYMAPEQLRGEPADRRSDIWAAGVVLYEMATARLPFSERVHPATADAIQHRPVPPPRKFAESLWPRLEQVILKCLEKHPHDRYQSAEELLEGLRAADGSPAELEWSVGRMQVGQWKRIVPRSLPARLALYVLLIAVIAAVVWRLIPKPQPILSPLETKYIAVLPFVAVEPDPGAHAFSQGLSEALTAKLTQLTEKHPLQVVPASEIRTQAVTSVQQARMGLGVNLVLEGSFHQSRGLMRVTYDLVDARTLRVLRADTITAVAKDPFGLEDRVVDSALRSLDLELTAQERQRLETRGTSQPAAYDSYLRGRGYLQDYQKPENIESAIAAFRSTLERDPQYAPAHAALGESYWQKFEFTHDRQWIEKAEAECQVANMAGLGHGCLGTIYNGTGKYEQAAAEFQRELAADATSDSAYRGLGFAYEHMGKPADAEQTYRRAINLRPQYWASHSWLGAFLYRHGRYDEAAQAFTKVTELAPDNVRGYNNLGGLYAAMGRYADAVPALERSISLQPSPDAWSNLGTANFYLHRFPEAVHAYEEAVKLDERNRTSWGNLADAYYWAPGRRNDSAAAYRKAIALGEEQLRVNPRDAKLLSYLAAYHAMVQEERPAASNLASALSLSPGDAEILFNAALVTDQLGDTEKSIARLRQAVDAGWSPALVRNHPNLENLQSDKRFQTLLRENKPAK